jgi:hypothetical protein
MEAIPMQLTIERRFRQNNKDGITFLAVFSLVLGEPVPLSMNYLRAEKLNDLAVRWYMLEAENPHRPDLNNAAVMKLSEWPALTVQDLMQGQEFAADEPVVIVAVEEAIRRALEMLVLTDPYAEPFRKKIETILEVGSADCKPTGLIAPKP